MDIEDDERVDIAALRARIALARNDLEDAEQWARRGVEQVEKIRAAQSALELRPWVLSTRREPYELLFVALARAGRARDAMLAFDQWQGRTLLDAMARPSPLAPPVTTATRSLNIFMRPILAW